MLIAANSEITPEIEKHLESYFAYPHPEACAERLAEVLDPAQKRKGAAVKVYLENFKAYNDTFGYQFGHRLIKEVAKFLCTLEGADVYRIAGVEFVVIFDQIPRQAAQKLVDEVADRFEASWHIDNLDCMCTANIGAAFYPGPADSAPQMLEFLGHAISESSRMGQNHPVTYDDDLGAKLYRKNSIAKQIPKALEDGQVEVTYRPVRHVTDQRFSRADSYMRMFTEEFGPVTASEFIPIAEESGQIYSISQYAVSQACGMISQLLKENVPFETIAVPISPIQFLQERFVEDVRSIIEESGVPAEKLAFEVTEGVALSAFSSAQMTLSDLSELGIEIVLTEFGTGYSGINNILSMPVDVVKLEKMLIWQMENDPRGAFLVEGLVHIAKNLGLKLIADGVESQAQVELLAGFGCEYQQGFYYSAALTPNELIQAFKGE